MSRLFSKYKVRSSGLYGFVASLILLSAATLICELLRHYVLPINLLMIYLLTVVLVSLKIGLKPAIATVALGGFVYNYLYVPPRFVFEFLSKEYLSTYFGLFITGAVISSLVTKVSDRAEALEAREAETSCLYHLSRELAVAADTASILHAVINNVEDVLHLKIAVFLPTGDQLEMVASSKELNLDSQELEASEWSFRNGKVAGHGTASHGKAKFVYFPLQTLSKTIGVLGIIYAENSVITFEQMQRMIEAFSAQTAMALERVNLSIKAEKANFLRARQKLERALLNSVSHDLRSPLATITGVLSSILGVGNNLSEQTKQELLENAREEAIRLNQFVGKLLEISRLEARATVLKFEPCDIEDLVGCALSAIRYQRKDRLIEVKLAADLPMASMDMVLMNQVLVNLLDNALKYSPPDSAVKLSALSNDENLIIQVADAGPGLPENELQLIFEKFYRIAVPESVKGTGLGLSICHGIVEAHNGKIWAENLTGGGFMITVEIPLKQPCREQDN